MANVIERCLTELGIQLPTPATSVANYLPFSPIGSAIIISGQIPILNGEVQYKGKVGIDLTLEEGQAAARLCGLNILAQLKVACDGDLSRVQRCLRLGGFVNCGSDFTDHAKVINGVSDLMVQVFGSEIGRHARAAVGVNSLPLGSAVEVEALFKIND